LRNSWFEASGREVPRVLLGTSPFIGAGQFWPRSEDYWARFYGKPEEVAEVIMAAVELGVVGVQPLPCPFLAEAIRIVQRETGTDLALVITIGPDEPLKDLRIFDDLDVRVALIHGSLTDEASGPELEAILGAVRDEGLPAGYVTHSPMKMLSRISSGVIPRPDLVLLPFNKLGYLMDAPAGQIADAIRHLGVPAMGKKVLAAGRLRPRDGLEFALRAGVLEGVAIGAVSRAEVQETFGLLAELMPWAKA